MTHGPLFEDLRYGSQQGVGRDRFREDGVGADHLRYGKELSVECAGHGDDADIGRFAA